MSLLTLLSPNQEHYLQRFQANVGAGGSFDPAIVLAAGAPTPVWTVTDQAATTEKVVNGGFESALGAEWVISKTDGTVARDAVVYHGASGNSLKLVQNSTGVGLSAFEAFAVIPGKTYNVNYWVYGDGSHIAYKRIYDQTNAADIVAPTSLGVLAAEWVNIPFSFTAPAGCLIARIYHIPAAVAGAFFYVDDISVMDTSNTTVYNTAGITHIQSGAGVMSVSLGPPSILPYITQIDANTDGLIGVFSQADLMRLPALAQLRLYSNLSLSCRFSLASLPPAMFYLYLYNTSGYITGSLSDLKVDMTTLILQNTPSTITGGATPIVATGLTNLNLGSTARSQAQVDEIVARLYADRALFTAAAPALLIGGTNAAPSGVYADEDPPVSGKGMIYELVVDPEAEGFRKWAVTYTA